MAVKTGTLVPGLSGSHSSAKSHSSMRRGSTTIILAPYFSTAAFICRAMIGWFSVVFEPVTMNTSLRITSAAVLLMADEPMACCRATTEPAWHSRVQWSMLLVRNRARNIFCSR